MGRANYYASPGGTSTQGAVSGFTAYGNSGAIGGTNVISSPPSSSYSGGGGGGAGGAASPNDTSTQNAAGGVGRSNSISGSAVTYAAGGDGSNASALAGSANTGDGARAAASGGSGVVILRMATSDYSGNTTGSPTVTTDGADTILTFTGSGSYIA